MIDLCNGQGPNVILTYPHDKSGDDYDKDLADYLFGLSILVTRSICNDEELKLPKGIKGQEMFETVDDKGLSTLVYAFWNDKDLFFVFAGTMTKAQAYVDLQYPLVPTIFGSGVQCHSGFYNSYMSVRSSLKSLARIYKNKNLFITGHSLGGALSTIAALDFEQSKPVHYSFAAPRSGNNLFALDVNDKVEYTYRVNNTSDIIPQLPPAVFGRNNYTHAGENINFTLNLDSFAKNHIDAYFQYLSEDDYSDYFYTDSNDTTKSSPSTYCSDSDPLNCSDSCDYSTTTSTNSRSYSKSTSYY